jgi:hypothetical protein
MRELRVTLEIMKGIKVQTLTSENSGGNYE